MELRQQPEFRRRKNTGKDVSANRNIASFLLNSFIEKKKISSGWESQENSGAMLDN